MFDTGPIRRNVVVAAVCATVGCSAPIDSADRERIVSAALTEDDAASTQWTGTWSASPESCGAGTQLGGRTLRQIVHTSIGGSAVRVEVSNVFGTSALAIADVHVAQRASDSSITQGTDHSVTFGGEAAASVAAGALAVSDPVALEVAPLSDVSVSIYFPLSTGASETCHSTALQTSYIASGDLSGAPNLSGAVTTGSYFFLTAIDVRNSAASGALVTLGASITDGIASASDDDRRWPNDLAVRLTNAGQTVGVLNQGISGNQLLVDGSGQSALHRLGRDVLAQAGVRWVVFADDPINDLGDSHSTAAQLIAGLKQLIVMAHQSGVAFLCATLTPFQGAAYWSSTEETEREAYDTFVRTENSGCDRVVDMDGATPTTPPTQRCTCPHTTAVITFTRTRPVFRRWRTRSLSISLRTPSHPTPARQTRPAPGRTTDRRGPMRRSRRRAAAPRRKRVRQRRRSQPSRRAASLGQPAAAPRNSARVELPQEVLARLRRPTPAPQDPWGTSHLAPGVAA
jgi:hypothetical protein